MAPEKEEYIELKKHPETEMEYWQTIEALGGVAWSLNHDLSDGRIDDDPTCTLDKTIKKAYELSAKLASELSEKFGVIQPKDCPKVEIGQKPPKPPKGKKYYWKWYEKMEKIYYKMSYEKIICSACPFSEGVNYMIELGGWIPCGVVCGSRNMLRYPFKCGVWEDEKKVREEIIKKGGELAFVRFKIKEAGLRIFYNAETREVEVL